MVEERKIIAVAVGGFSAEREVSLRSGKLVLQHLDPLLYECYLLDIRPEGWFVLGNDQEIPFNRENATFLWGGEAKKIEALFNAVHGSPGEDGVLAAWCTMLRIPQTASEVLASALTFSKSECNQLLRAWGYPVPKGLYPEVGEAPSAETVERELGWPCFLKPSRSGSSIGVSKVKGPEEWPSALAQAQEIDAQLVVEEMVNGIELGCGVFQINGAVRALAVTDIVPQNEWFDYQSKYSGFSEEITPARIPEEQYRQVMAMSESVYQKLQLRGLVRVDYILQTTGELRMIEVNTVPGFSAESILPKQAGHAGFSLAQLFGQSLAQALNQPQ